MIDFHTHILPGIDDGCKTADESVKALKIMLEDGIDTVVATPHYDIRKESIDDFAKRREEAYEKLIAYAAENGAELPKIILGAETAFFPGMYHTENIEKLCIGETNYMLVELPFTKWEPSTAKELHKLAASRGITPIAAHVERYGKLREHIEMLSEYQIPMQVNANSVMRFPTRQMLAKYIKNGTVQIIASDCHNAEARPPNLGKAMKLIEKTYGKGKTEKMEKLWNLMIKYTRC